MPPRRSSNTYTSQGTSQRRRRSPSLEEGSDDAGNDEQDAQPNGDDGPDEDSQGAKGGLKDNEIKAKAGQLVRYALFQEYRRTPIRRSDIIKNVIPKTPRAYNLVLTRAQSILRLTIGCELYELRARNRGEVVRLGQAGGEASQAQGQATQNQTHGQRKGKGRARMDDIQEEEEDDDEPDEGDAGVGATQRGRRSAGSKTYILRSTLPAQLLERMSLSLSLPHEIENQDDQPDSGALLRWEKGDGTASGHIALLGIRTIILALVMCSGRVMSDDHLHALLRRLDLHRDTPLPYQSSDLHSKETPSQLTLDKYLDLLARQQYLEKVKLPGPNGDVDNGTVEWRWGNREAEFEEKAAARFIEEIMLGEQDSDEDDEPDPQPVRRRANGAASAATQRGGAGETRGAKRKKLQEDIVRAAGGPLVGAE